MAEKSDESHRVWLSTQPGVQSQCTLLGRLAFLGRAVRGLLVRKRRWRQRWPREESWLTRRLSRKGERDGPADDL